MRFVPMTDLQAARVNSAIASGKDPSVFLSPNQIRMLASVKAHPGLAWKNLIGADDLQKSWDNVAALSNLGRLEEYIEFPDVSSAQIR